MSLDLDICHIDTVNNLDNQIILVCGEASKVNNEDVWVSIKTRDTSTQSDTRPSFNHGIINDNFNVETILDHFKELIVKAQDLQAS